MVKKILALVAVAFFVAGCGTEFRSYVMTKPRVGLEQGSGNAGCVVGKCTMAPSAETTRKVYVLEITKPVPESEVKKIEETAVNAIADTAPSTEAAPAAEAPVPVADNTQAAPSQPSIQVVGERPGENSSEEAAPAAPGPEGNGGNVQGSTYTVQKDDTLQKISKKVYGTYGKWYKIYEANKDRIKNPNILKPGTVLTIPGLK